MSQRRRRIAAFLIDMLIVTFVTVCVSNLSYLNPYKDNYEEATEKYQEVYNEYRETIFNSGSGFTSDKDIFEYVQKSIVPSMYKVEKYNLFANMWYIGVYFLYFVVFVYFNDGQTVGKKLFKLKVVSADDSKASIPKLIIRSLLNGSNIYFGVNIIVIIRTLISLFNNTQIFFISAVILGILSYAFEIAMFVCLFVKKGTILINDKVAKTKIIMIK